MPNSSEGGKGSDFRVAVSSRDGDGVSRPPEPIVAILSTRPLNSCAALQLEAIFHDLGQLP